ncbi:hypothetical protein EW026_g165 [Hermanssonia centrifuga]|uniref:Uncharacterized protein n=2 Tax=Hermanssonia centrifuga TaxID=98765 RepID=A0A4S4KVC9_9APHY|nr:hypothetical protein PHLCEN_2v4829 [Hermanssonia centrifuga]THH02756.1 hypothetical protein EW026_g165 [Hermanssonia centrifuga]
MKIATQEELQGHHNATVRGAVEGVLAGLAISLPLSFVAQRKWAAYRALPIQLKVLGVITVVLPAYAIGAERRGVEYDESTWTGAGKHVLEREHLEEEKKWESYSGTEKLKDWALRNQYKVILGSWAASMAVAGAIVMTNKYQTLPQKVVQARMWAQGLTIGVLIGAGVMTHSQREQSFAQRTADHSWREMLEEQQREDEEHKKVQLPTRAHVPVA